MNSLSSELKDTIARRLEVATPAEVLAIVSQLCGNELAPPPTPTWHARDESSRFATNKYTVLDQSTGLVWTRDNVDGGAMNWSKAKEAAAAVRIDGYSDWRLPTIKELLTLVDYDRHAPAIDTDAFPKCESAWYWTSTPAALSPADYAWFVSFYRGVSNWGYRDYFGFVRAVRPS